MQNVIKYLPWFLLPLVFFAPVIAQEAKNSFATIQNFVSQEKIATSTQVSLMTPDDFQGVQYSQQQDILEELKLIDSHLIRIYQKL